MDHGVPRCLVKRYFWVCLGVLNITWGCFQRWIVFELMNWVKQMALSSVAGHHLSVEGLNRQKAGGRLKFFSAWLLELRNCSSVLKTPGSQASRFRLKSATFVLGLSGFWTTSTTCFLGLWLTENRLWDFSASIIMCVSILHDRSYTHTHTYHGFCFPAEPWLTCLSFNSLPAWPSLTAALLQHHGSLSLPASALSFLHPCLCLVGFPGDANGKEHACQCRRHRFDPWVRMIPWRRAWQLTPVILPGNFHGQRSLSGYSPRCHKEMDTAEQLSTHIRTHHIFLFTEVIKIESYVAWGKKSCKIAIFPCSHYLCLLA